MINYNTYLVYWNMSLFYNNNTTLSAVRQSEEDLVLRRTADRIQALRKRGSGQSNERNVRQRHNDNQQDDGKNIGHTPVYPANGGLKSQAVGGRAT
jgi:hypothetical protein